MTEQEWLTSSDPVAMLDWLMESHRPSDRKLRLWVVACRSLETFRDPETRGYATDGDDLKNDQVALEEAVRAWKEGVPEQETVPTFAERSRILRDIVGNPWRPVTLPLGEKCGVCEGSPVKGKYTPDGMGLNWFPCSCCHGTGHGPSPVLTPLVQSIAQAAYDERQEDGTLDDVTLAILADALEEAGCDNGELLMPLRGYEVCRHCMLPSPEEAEYGGGVYWCPGCGGTESGKRAVGHEYPYWMRSPGPHHPGFWALDLILGKE